MTYNSYHKLQMLNFEFRLKKNGNGIGNKKRIAVCSKRK